jgi:hypothetical protein
MVSSVSLGDCAGGKYFANMWWLNDLDALIFV